MTPGDEDHSGARGPALSVTRVAGFALRFMLVFTLLTVAWPWLKQPYTAVYRGIGNTLLVRFGSDGGVLLRPSSTLGPDHDTEFVLTNWRTGSEYSFAGSIRSQGYKPTALLFALIAATPVSLRRRGRALLWGLLCIHGYIAAKLSIFLLFAFSGDNALALFAPEWAARKALDFTHWVFVVSFAAWLIVPLPIWVLVTFRRGDWETAGGGWLGQAQRRHALQTLRSPQSPARRENP